MYVHQCWKCKEYFEQNQGKLKEMKVFTCFPCLRAWQESMRPIWKRENEKNRIQENKKHVNQMDLFEISEIFN